MISLPTLRTVPFTAEYVISRIKEIIPMTKAAPSAKSSVRDPEGDIATFIEEVVPSFCILPVKGEKRRVDP
jgi:hypothetical protein